MDKQTIKYICFGIIALCIISFFPILNADFINYDDPDYVINNNYLKHFNISNIKSIFSGEATILYVPLTIFSYLLEYTLFGENPKVFHFFNLLFHIINALLLFRILLKLEVKNKNLIYLILLFFSINPLVTESVCWITERKDVLYTLFYFLSVIQFLNYSQNKNLKSFILCFLFFILSCFSKPMAVSLPVIFLLYQIYKANKIEVKNLLVFIPFFIASFIFSVISVISIKNSAAPVTKVTQYNVFEKTSLVFSEMGYYFLKPFFPVNQKFINLFPEKNALLSNSSIIMYAIVALSIIAIITYSAFNKKNKLVGLLFLMWFVFLLPVLQVYPNTHSYISERYFYVSIIFPVVLIFILVQHFKIAQSSFKIVIPLLVLAFVLLTFKRSVIWKNSKTLFEQELKTDKNNTYALNNLGHYYNSKAEFPKAVDLLKRAIDIDKTNPFYLNNYAWALAGIGKTDSAIVYFTKAVSLKNNFSEALNNLGICYINKNENEKAFNSFSKAYAISPNNNEVLYNLGAYYLKIGQKEKARPYIRKAYELGNKSAVKYINY